MGSIESVLNINGNVTISRGSKLCGGSGEGSKQECRNWEESRSKEEMDDFGEAPVLVLQGAQDRVRPDWVSRLSFSIKILFLLTIRLSNGSACDSCVGAKRGCSEKKAERKRKKADVDLTADSDDSEVRRHVRAVEQSKPEWASEMSRAIAALGKTLAEMKLAEQTWRRDVDRKLRKIQQGIDKVSTEEEEEETLTETERRRQKDASEKGKEKEETEDADEADEADDADAEGSTPADGDVDMES